jgi:hypothetical protein
MLFLASLAPALFAAVHAANVADAAHDEAVVRAVGLGWTGGLRALDAAVAATLALVPLGTHAMRASLASAMLVGLSGGLLYVLARRILAACADLPRFGALVACAASLATTLGPQLQLEGASPGGGALGAVLTLLPVVILAGGERERRVPLAALAAGAALAYEPACGAAAIVACTALLGVASLGVARESDAARGRFPWRMLRVAACLAAAGLVPFVLAQARLHGSHELALSAGTLAAPLGEAGASAPISPIAFLQTELGFVVAGLALAGAALGAFVSRARPAIAALVTLAAAGAGAVALGAPAGPTRYAGPVLAAVAAVFALAAVAMQAIVRAVSQSRLPFARASAAMVVLLELTFPVHVADDAHARASARGRGAAAVWDEVAVGTLPAGAVVFVRDARVAAHLLASRAAGELRPDLAVVPVSDLGGPLARRELAREPSLSSFFRDVALARPPEELSLSQVAATRPLAVTFDPAWPRPLARQMVPLGLFQRFETEPRGLSDRRRALDAFIAARDRLALATRDPDDPELVSLTARLLRARAVGLAAAGEREVADRGAEDVRMFSPDDPVAVKLARRVATTKGMLDVRDLAP